MSHYEERLEQYLTRIITTVRDLGERVEVAVDRAVRALLTSDHDLSSAVIVGDLPINRDVRNLDRLCHVFVARHLPSAGHLRLVSSVLRLNIAIERTGGLRGHHLARGRAAHAAARRGRHAGHPAHVRPVAPHVPAGSGRLLRGERRARPGHRRDTGPGGGDVPGRVRRPHLRRRAG